MLAERFTHALGVKPVFPCEANAVFLRMPEELVVQLHGCGWHFYKFIEPDVYRFMCSWSVTEADINDFIKDVKAVARPSVRKSNQGRSPRETRRRTSSRED